MPTFLRWGEGGAPIEHIMPALLDHGNALSPKYVALPSPSTLVQFIQGGGQGKAIGLIEEANSRHVSAHPCPRRPPFQRPGPATPEAKTFSLNKLEQSPSPSRLLVSRQNCGIICANSPNHRCRHRTHGGASCAWKSFLVRLRTMAAVCTGRHHLTILQVAPWISGWVNCTLCTSPGSSCWMMV